jgi:hypothetical protein
MAKRLKKEEAKMDDLLDSIDETDEEADDGIDLPDPKPKASSPRFTDMDDDEENDVESELRSLFNSQGETTYGVAVLKYNSQTKTFPQIASFTDITDASEIPNTEEIGKEYGGGKYKILVKYALPKGGVKRWSRVFELDKSYDRFLNKPAPIQAAPAGSEFSPMQMMMMMQAQNDKANERFMQMQSDNTKTMMTMLSCIIPAIAANKKEDVNSELLKEIIHGTKKDPIAELRSMTELMKEMKSTAKYVNDEETDDDYEDEDDDYEEEDVEASDPVSKAIALIPAIGTLLKGKDEAQNGVDINGNAGRRPMPPKRSIQEETDDDTMPPKPRRNRPAVNHVALPPEALAAPQEATHE